MQIYYMNTQLPIILSVAKKRTATHWDRKHYTWGELVSALSHSIDTGETLEEYQQGTKAFRDDKKDVGGFVGAVLKDHKRNKKNVVGRDIITLDLDNCTEGDEEAIRERIQALEYVLYSTHSHTPEKPRYRLVMPLSRRVDRDEYSIISRAIAHAVGDSYFDPSTFQPERLMYWPSHPSDTKPVYIHNVGKAIEPAEWLDMDQGKWREVRHQLFPESDRKQIDKELGEAVDPTTKQGFIGAFCRAYSIREAISTFLSHIYEPAPEGRYTYIGASTVGGVVVYQDRHIYSHHSTDPYSDMLLNAYDMVRLHLYGDLDKDISPQTKLSARPSTEAMGKLCDSDKAVRQALIGASFDVEEDFEDDTKVAVSTAKSGKPKRAEKPSTDWYDKLELDPKKGTIKSTRENITIILENDPELKGRMYLDTFTDDVRVRGSLPWDLEPKVGRQWTDRDDAALRCYIETRYAISDKAKVQDATDTVFLQHALHPVRRYLDGLKWDGTARLETLFVDYLGAEDTAYTRAITRKALAGAVARIYEPGTKFDYIIVLAGREGIGKSTILKRLGGEWYSDSFYTVEGKEAMEQLRGKWLIEVAELAGLKKSEMVAIKAFISKQSDTYRSAYGRRKETRQRECIFFATTNEHDFLRNENGNRRFWVLPVGQTEGKGKPWEMTDELIAQVWAEAKEVYKRGEVLTLNKQESEALKAMQDEYEEDDVLVSMIDAYLTRPLPSNFYNLTAEERRAFIQRQDATKGRVLPQSAIYRSYISISEIMNEMPTQPWSGYDRRKSFEVGRALSKLSYCKKGAKAKKTQHYGVVKVWDIDTEVIKARNEESGGEVFDSFDDTEDLPF